MGIIREIIYILKYFFLCAEDGMNEWPGQLTDCLTD